MKFSTIGSLVVLAAPFVAAAPVLEDNAVALLGSKRTPEDPLPLGYKRDPAVAVVPAEKDKRFCASPLKKN